MIEPWEEVVNHKIIGNLTIADRDYYEIDADGNKKTKFTWDEAMEIEKKTNGKWRVPTPKELTLMAYQLGFNSESVFDGELFAKNLGIIGRFKEDGYCRYWSSRVGGANGSYSLVFGSSYLNPQLNYSKGYGFAVRCVA